MTLFPKRRADSRKLYIIKYVIPVNEHPLFSAPASSAIKMSRFPVA
jgi:hypothetical protein